MHILGIISPQQENDKLTTPYFLTNIHFNQVSASVKLFKANIMYNYSIDKDLHELTN